MLDKNPLDHKVREPVGMDCCLQCGCPGWLLCPQGELTLMEGKNTAMDVKVCFWIVCFQCKMVSSSVFILLIMFLNYYQVSCQKENCAVWQLTAHERSKTGKIKTPGLESRRPGSQPWFCHRRQSVLQQVLQSPCTSASTAGEHHPSDGAQCWTPRVAFIKIVQVTVLFPLKVWNLWKT